MVLALAVSAALAPGLALAHGRGGWGGHGWGHWGGGFHSSAPVYGGGWRGGGWSSGPRVSVGFGYRAPIYAPVVRPRYYGWRSPAVVLDFGLPSWRAGRWYYGWHGTSVGWWWGVNNVWYSYPAPIYPYPQSAPAIAEPVQEAPVYYYCRSAGGYYPDVSTCAEGWQTVAAQPTSQP